MKDKSGKAQNGKVAKERSNYVVTDPRFARLHNDPRFRKFPKDTHKVQIDDRFKAMFEDAAFQGVQSVDKRGRKVGPQKSKGQDLKRYYRLQAQNEEDAADINGDNTAKRTAPADGATSAKPQTPVLEAPATPGRGKGPGAPVKAAPLADGPCPSALSPSVLPLTPSTTAEPLRNAPHQQQNRDDAHRTHSTQRRATVGAAAASAGVVSDKADVQAGARLDGSVAGGQLAGTSAEEESGVAEMTEQEKRWARARGLLEDSGSDSDSDDSSSEGDSDDEVASLDSADRGLREEEWGVGTWAANPEEQVPEGSPTRRIALVDLDWRVMSAVDILAALRSFCPAGGTVQSVTVYPSDYGLQKMAAEVAAGPQAVFTSKSAAIASPRGRTGTKSRAKRTSVLPKSSTRNVDLDLLDSSSESTSPSNHDNSDSGEDARGLEEPHDDARGLEEPHDDVTSDDDDDVLAAMAEVSGSDEGFASGDDGEGGQHGFVGPGEADTESDDGMTEEEKVQAARVRAYERSKLRWYYAVAVCDSIQTASHLYDECDGLEFGRSSCKFDMRFVPDSMDLGSRAVRDIAKSVPPSYEPPNFHSMALQHTRAHLTWDEDSVQRKRVLSRRVAVEDLKDDDFKAYLASESDSDEDKEAPHVAAERYRKLLAGVGNTAGTNQDTDATAADDEDEDRPGNVADDKSMEMEVTFAPGLEQLGKKILEQQRDKKRQKEGETVWEAYMRRKREKRRLAKEMGRAHVRDSSDESDVEGVEDATQKEKAAARSDDDPFADPFFNDDNTEVVPVSDSDEEAAAQQRQQQGPKAQGAAKNGLDKKRKAHKAAAEGDAAARRAAELDLLLMDDDALARVVQTGNTAHLQHVAGSHVQNGSAAKPKPGKARRAEARKAAKKRERQQGSDDEDLGVTDGFVADLSDPRFAAVVTSPDFALDPTDPRFKQAQQLAKQVTEQRRKEGKGVAKQAPAAASNKQIKVPQKQQDEPSKQQTGSLSAMVANLKHKGKRKKV